MNTTATLMLALALALGLAACGTGGPVADSGTETEGASSGPTVYGKVHVSTDHVRTR
jgi:ABC-type glycerol-3-phosphate transport system substrate-binding protein